MSVKLAVADGASCGLVAVTVPEAPTAGVVAVQPDGAVNETNVVLNGTESLSKTL